MLTRRVTGLSRLLLSHRTQMSMPSCSFNFWSRNTEKSIQESEIKIDDDVAEFETAEEIGAIEKNDGVFRPWEDPLQHAIEKTTTYTDFKEAQVDWSYVERLLPPKIISEIPKDCGITPSGWRAPRDPPPDLPYYIRRRRDHLLPLYLERRRDELNPNTMDFQYVELVKLNQIYGDVFACEKDLREFLEKEVNHPIATHVDELKGTIRVKGADRTLLEKFVFEQGF